MMNVLGEPVRRSAIHPRQQQSAQDAANHDAQFVFPIDSLYLAAPQNRPGFLSILKVDRRGRVVVIKRIVIALVGCHVRTSI